ncbi:MAG: AmmeMemoRadiSam system protein B [Bacteroidota bacterium]
MKKVAYPKVRWLFLLTVAFSSARSYAAPPPKEKEVPKKKKKGLPWRKVFLGLGSAGLAVKYLSSRKLVEENDDNASLDEPKDFKFVEEGWFPKEKKKMMDLREQTFPEIKAAIVPHAGVKYSGTVVANALQKVDWRLYDTFLLLATSHKIGKNYQLNRQKLNLPYRPGSVDILNIPALKFVIDEQRLQKEHSWQILLSYINEVNEYLVFHGYPPLKFIPLIIGKELSPQELNILQTYLQNHPKTFLCANTDLLHRPGTMREDASTWKAFDQVTIKQIKQAITHGTPLTRERDGKSTMCGFFAIQAFTRIAHNSLLIPLHKEHRHSFQASQETQGQYVGYLGMTLKKMPLLELPAKVLAENPQVLGRSLSKKEINHIAKKYEKANDQPVNGIFVTINKGRSKTLRGCMGKFNAKEHGLHYWVARQTLQSALGDGRFDPVTQAELTDLSFEISLLEPSFNIYNKKNDQSTTPFQAFKKNYNSKNYGITITFDDGRGATYLPSVLQREKGSLKQLFHSVVNGLRRKSNPERFRNVNLHDFNQKDFTSEIAGIELYMTEIIK